MSSFQTSGEGARSIQRRRSIVSALPPDEQLTFPNVEPYGRTMISCSQSVPSVGRTSKRISVSKTSCRPIREKLVFVQVQRVEVDCRASVSPSADRVSAHALESEDSPTGFAFVVAGLVVRAAHAAGLAAREARGETLPAASNASTAN